MELKERAKQIVETPDMIVSGIDWSIQWLSSNLRKKFGYTDSEIIGMNTLHLHPGEIDEALEINREIHESKKGILIHIPIKTKKGRKSHINLKIRHFDYNKEHFMVGKLI